jgi:hypothetical protein
MAVAQICGLAEKRDVDDVNDGAHRIRYRSAGRGVPCSTCVNCVLFWSAVVVPIGEQASFCWRDEFGVAWREGGGDDVVERSGAAFRR